MPAKSLQVFFLKLPRWQQWSTLVALGGVGNLAFAPLHFVWVLIPVLSGLLSLVTAVSTRRAAFALGWWFGLGHFLVGFYWVGNAFIVADIGLLAGILSVVLLSVVSAVSIGVVAFFCNFVRTSGLNQLVFFASLWTAAEWCRSFLVLGGFPWNLMGYVWGFSDAMVQVTSVTGVFGLSAMTVFCAAAASPLLNGTFPVSLRGLKVLFAALALMFSIWLGGMIRLDAASEDMFDGIRLRLVQANITQHHKWSTELREAHFKTHLELSRRPSPNKITHVIWPETATPYALGTDANARSLLGTVTPAGGLLITGSIRVSDKQQDPLQIWNGLRVVSVSGEIVGSYDKRRLVPFGEYVPFRGWLPIEKLVEGSQDYSRGAGKRTLNLPGLPLVAPLICFEVIFPGSIVDKQHRPEWLLNLTNDAWYGRTAGPYQHLVQARFRAVEEGLPLIRAANTGISASIDAYGRIVTSLELGRRGVLDTGLPTGLSEGTFYSRQGDAPVLFVVLFIIGITFVRRIRGVIGNL